MWLLREGWNCVTKVNLLCPSCLSSPGSCNVHCWLYIPVELLWDHFAGGRGQCGQFLGAPFFWRLLHIPTGLGVHYWQTFLHIYRKTAYQDPLEALSPSCLLGSVDCSLQSNPDLGIQPVSFLYGRGVSRTIHSALNDVTFSLGWRCLLPSSIRASTVVPNLTVGIYSGKCIVRQFNITLCDT